MNPEELKELESILEGLLDRRYSYTLEKGLLKDFINKVIWRVARKIDNTWTDEMEELLLKRSSRVSKG